MKGKKPGILSAAMSLACVAGALLITLSLHSVFPTPLFFAAIVVSTWYGGPLSGLLAVGLAAFVLDFYFVPPVGRFGPKPGEAPYLIQFFIPALVTCWFVQKRKDAESSLRSARDELEFKVQERTRELREANQRLQEQIAERIRAEETVQKIEAELAHVSRVTTLGELAASIAHEVNQPLMAVVLNGDACLQWLGRERPNLDEAREAVGRIIAEGNRAGEIIRRIRALFQKTEAHKAPVDLNELIRDILALTQREMARHNIVCTTALDAALPRVLGDRVQLQQVILNVVMNAIEAMSEPQGEHRLHIGTERADAAHVLASVRDSGRGFPPGEADRLFAAFFTTKPDGLGMGLSISRTIVEAHGGKLWASSSGQGALFQFRLPALAGNS